VSGRGYRLRQPSVYEWIFFNLAITSCVALKNMAVKVPVEELELSQQELLQPRPTRAGRTTSKLIVT